MTLQYDPARNTVRTPGELAVWLGADSEDVLEPALPIIDPHHHVWFRPAGHYLRDELLADIGSGHTVVATVFIECNAENLARNPDEAHPARETAFVVAATPATVAMRPVLCAGIVGRADLRLGDRVTPILEAHRQAGNGRFRGIRQPLRWDATGIGMFGRQEPASLALDPAFRSGFARLAPLGLSFDAWLFHPQLDELVDLARAHPDTTIIINHVGGPLGVGPYAGRRDEIFAQWLRGVSALAECPNTLMKLGGLGMLYYGFDFHEQPTPPSSAALAAAWQPYILTCIEKFGVSRCMFESNFPVDKQSCSYRVLWNAFKTLTKDFSAGEKAALYHDTAARAYRITV